MLFWNIFVFFLLPLLVLFLTRKLSVRGMILWTAGCRWWLCCCGWWFIRSG